MLAAAQDPVSWLLANPKLLLIVFPAAIWLINQIRALSRARPPGQPGESGTDVDDAEAERTRRVQEEVRRKIAERRGERPAAPPIVTPRTAPRTVVQPRVAVQPAAWSPAAPAAPAMGASPAPPSFPATMAPAVAELLFELHDPSQIRRAIILREVLGPPVALR